MDNVFEALGTWIEDQVFLSREYLGRGTASVDEYHAVCGGISALLKFDLYVRSLKSESLGEDVD